MFYHSHLSFEYDTFFCFKVSIGIATTLELKIETDDANEKGKYFKRFLSNSSDQNNTNKVSLQLLLDIIL